MDNEIRRLLKSVTAGRIVVRAYRGGVVVFQELVRGFILNPFFMMRALLVYQRARRRPCDLIEIEFVDWDDPERIIWFKPDGEEIRR